MGKTWLIKVKATEYNILGAVRMHEEVLPWHFEKNASVERDDKVYFYLTNSKTNNKNMLLDGMFKRFLFEGRVVRVLDDYDDSDSDFWNNSEHHDTVKNKELKSAFIEITKNLYDCQIRSGDVNPKIWDAKYKQCDVYTISAEMESSIQAAVMKHQM